MFARRSFSASFAAGVAVCILGLAVCSVAPAAIVSNVVFGNLGVSGTGAITNTNTNIGPVAGYFIAQGFTAASPKLEVTSIKLGLFGGDPIPVSATIGIYADNFGVPAPSALYTSAVTSVGAKNLYEFSFTSAQLTNGSSYWVIPQQAANLSWYTASPVPAGQNSSGYVFTQTLEYDDNGEANWVSAPSNRYSVSIQAVPEPPTYALAAIGSGIFGLVNWRRRWAVRVSAKR